jgi:hypothetical protein
MSRRIGLRDRLGRLTVRGAQKLLGDDGDVKLRQSGHFEIEYPRHVYLGADTLRVNVPDPDAEGGRAIVTIVEMANKPKGLHLTCDRCPDMCVHIAAVIGFVLEEKLTLGIAAAPDPSEPLEHLTEDELIARALADRKERAAQEAMTLRSTDPATPWADYTITSQQ